MKRALIVDRLNASTSSFFPNSGCVLYAEVSIFSQETPSFSQSELWLHCAFCRLSQEIADGMPYTEFDITWCRVQNFISTALWKYVPFLQGAILLSIKGGKLCCKCNLPTLIWNALNRYPQHLSPLFTMYTSLTGSTRPKSTLHQGVVPIGPVEEQEPRRKIVELIPSTAFLLTHLP